MKDQSQLFLCDIRFEHASLFLITDSWGDDTNYSEEEIFDDKNTVNVIISDPPKPS
jgi:hypothetical protein